MSDDVHDLDLETAPADLAELSDHMAGAAAQFVRTIEAVATADQPDEAVSILLLELSSLLAAGAPLGAIEDVVPNERFEPDAGAEPDIDRLRNTLHELLGPVDDYVEVFDPYAGPEVMGARLSDDLAQITSDLLHGLAHHAAGRPLEALWWWQFSYLSTWGQAASAALRALQSLVAHVRLEVPIETELLDVDVDL
jgi:Domain of unknown function (DUF5063)